MGGGACGGLTELYLYRNGIGDGGAAALEATLKSGACGSLTQLDLPFNQIGPEAQHAIDDALADVPQAVRRRAARTVAALQRLAFARVAVGADSARWSTGGPVATAIDALPFVASPTVGAPDDSLLLEVRRLFAALPPAPPAAVTARHSAQPAEHLARDRALAAAALVMQRAEQLALNLEQ